MTPATYNFGIVRGSSGPLNGLVFELQTEADSDATEPGLVNVPYDDVYLTVFNSKNDEQILRVHIGDGITVEVVDGVNRFTWSPTTAQTRLLPKGDGARYEVEVHSGGFEIVYLLGCIRGIGGINGDAP